MRLVNSGLVERNAVLKYKQSTLVLISEVSPLPQSVTLLQISKTAGHHLKWFLPDSPSRPVAQSTQSSAPYARLIVEMCPITSAVQTSAAFSPSPYPSPARIPSLVRLVASWFLLNVRAFSPVSYAHPLK